MKKIEIFYLNSCPYCRSARKAVAELCEENPAYASLTLNWIEEDEHPELSDCRDYACVPCLFYGDEKLYEAHFTHSYDVIKESIRSAFDRVLKLDSGPIPR